MGDLGLLLRITNKDLKNNNYDKDRFNILLNQKTENQNNQKILISSNHEDK